MHKKALMAAGGYLVLGGAWWLLYTNVTIPVGSARIPQPGAELPGPADLWTVALWPWSVIASAVNAIPAGTT